MGKNEDNTETLSGRRCIYMMCLRHEAPWLPIKLIHSLNYSECLGISSSTAYLPGNNSAGLLNSVQRTKQSLDSILSTLAHSH